MGTFFRHIFTMMKKRFCRSTGTDALLPLQQDVNRLKKEVALLRELLESQHWRIEKFHVDRMHVEQFTINLESINVDQLGGALNVGITHSCLVSTGDLPAQKEPENQKNPPAAQSGKEEGYILTFRLQR
ncbi:hypothetical protein SAMN02745219_01320 [Desulfofundulus thermosubterraneus DSM 16057]|uniref:Uncharacterized protein n=1 Tax=Desulfofundulus thermosubterraneus DSM 16057 TaxID=1121432 RepID=A0A1M6EXQ0_9FIRM|nr:hypothetical protein SAMN02745219_01320 [Desulfofundulus thermosubterraneus DSM 16057]